MTSTPGFYTWLRKDVSPGLQLPQPSMVGTRVTIRLRRVRAKTQVINLRHTSQTPIDIPNRSLTAHKHAQTRTNVEGRPRSTKAHFEPDPSSKLQKHAHNVANETRTLDDKQGRVESGIRRSKKYRNSNRTTELTHKIRNIWRNTLESNRFPLQNQYKSLKSNTNFQL